MRLGLGLGLSRRGHAAPKQPLCDAIAKKRCVSATHKKRRLIIAPHVVYNSNNGQMVDAVVVEQDGKAPNKPKVETFKVAELASPTVADRSFTPHSGFDPGDIKYSGKIVCIVEVV